MLVTSLLLASAVLPPVIADPRHGPSTWAVVREGETPPNAAGYLLELPSPPQVAGQGWLETAVTLAAHGAPVVALGAALPPDNLLPYLDGACLDPAPPDASITDLLGRLAGLPLVVPAADAATAVAALAAGAGAVLLERPAASWEKELVGLLPEPVAARSGGQALATALRGTDLATVVGLPRGFAGGAVMLPGAWYGATTLLGAEPRTIELQRRGNGTLAKLPPQPDGGVLVALRPAEKGGRFEQVEVSGERLPSAAEVLARHQRKAARQERLVPRWRAEQRLLVRVWVAELSRSFEVVLTGPVFFERGVGSDWEITGAWVDGVVWDADALPDLPLLEARRPPVPPLALRLVPTYGYELRGVAQRQGRPCFALEFGNQGKPGEPVRRGTAFIDAATFGLVELDESASGLAGEVRATRATTTYRQVEFAGEAFWLPAKVVADDLVSTFGGTTTVHRELTLEEVGLNPDGFAARRTAAYASPHRMLRDAAGGIVPLLPDGKGGRVVGVGARPAQRFLLVGAVYDAGLSFPVPFGGLQIQDFDFRGRGEQLRLLVAGVVNDGAWSARHGTWELSVRASTQLLPFSNTVFVGGQEQKDEEIKIQRQRVGAGVATTVGVTRFLLDLGVDRWDFQRTDNTAGGFVLPDDTFEGVGLLQTEVLLGATTLSVAGESGWRQHWDAWGIAGNEKPERIWRRGRLSAVYEKALFPLAKLHLDGELWVGSHLDRFSAPSPARFGGVRIRGIATGRVIPERLGVVRASLALPLSLKIRGEVGVDAAWARDDRSGYRARPLSGVGAGVTAPGPWGTLLQASVGYPLATPGPRSPTFDVFLLRPLARSQ